MKKKGKSGSLMAVVTSVVKKRGRKKKEKVVYIVSTMRFGYMYGNKKRSADGIYHSFRKRTNKTQQKYFTIVTGRTWGWFSDFEIAEKSVLENWGDIFEGEYSLAVIEEVPEGSVVNVPNKEYWYQWKGSWEKGKYVRALDRKPREYKNVVSFWGHKVLKEGEEIVTDEKETN